ncbi:hypothetical protein AG4045_019568 [Apium graveolens]|uniref:endo-polygalacturonase n=2 Tax=Magnoliopsida TaxID=3398 RepID=A0A6L5BF16_APIGR|nr:hypothetical protein AG4045_019568 [Apium graveolens]
MGEIKDNDAYEEELIDYEEEDEKAPDSATAKAGGDAVKKGYVGIHSSGFRDFLLKPELLRAIVDSGFEHPSEVQHECIPQAILGMDVICQAKSGMGKTAVFVLSTLQQIEPVAGQVSALVLCHTRELAYQICHEFERFSTYLPDIKVAVFYGGVNIKIHKDLLKNECPHVVVGTPGRILGLARDKNLGLKNVRHFILDECDKMLESLDMRKDVQDIFKMTPHDKQVMMFSATLSKEIRPVCKKFMQDPMEIYVDDDSKLTLHGLVQHYIKLSEMEKNRKLNDLLDALDFNQVVIFVKSVSRAAELNKLLVECNFPSICIHSGMSQEESAMVTTIRDYVVLPCNWSRYSALCHLKMSDPGVFLRLEIGTLPGWCFSANLRLSTSSSTTANNSYNVMSYGAIGDGTIDDSQAFMKAWKAACQGKSFDSTLIIPQNKTFLLKPLQFSGPCKSPNIYLKLSGTIVAPNNKLEWTGYHINAWLTFSYINGLVITGDGQIDGQGSAWWSQPCLQDLHTVCNYALVFHSCNGLRLSGLTHSNSPRVHIILTNCYDAVLSNLRITAPETSPNTDGINVSGSKNVTVKNSYIGTGDDCIAVSGGSSFVNITGISCGPGHGISIGALGKGGHDEVEEIHVRNCTLQGTLTGVRVKSWQGGSGYARKISFENIKLIDVNNPIIIDQFYCPSRVNCQNSERRILSKYFRTSAVELSDIRYKSIVGTSGTDQVINLSCSRSHGCTNIRIERVYIRSMTPGKRINANCINAHGTWSHTIPDVKCLLP